MRFLFPIVYLIAILALIVAVMVAWIGISFRQFETVEVAGDLNCTQVRGVYGAADIEPVPDTPIAYMSSLDRRGEKERGSILRFDTDNPLDSASWRDRTGGKPVVFQPMGIDLFSTILPDGRELQRLFVVNVAGPSVLLYDITASGDLILREVFRDPRLTSPNDVVATGPRSFYVSNDTAAGRDSFRGKIDFLLGLKSGQVLHYDGNSWSDVLTGLAFPNGLALSQDGETLYLAEMRAKRLLTFARDPQTDSIREDGVVRLRLFPDNLSVEQDGTVTIGAIPQPLSFTAYGEGLREYSASTILQVTTEGDVEMLFQDTGEEISAATVGVSLGNKFLIGSRAADRFLMCDKN